jgi:hypothetical protein
MATTTITAVDALKSALRDRGGSFLSDNEYEQVLLAKCAQSATYQARRITPGYWVVPYSPLCLFAASFSEQPGCDYELSCGGVTLEGAVSIKLTAGVDVRETIDVTGCALDFNAALSALLVYIATHRAQEYSQSMAGGSISPDTARRGLLDQAAVVRGVVAA